MRTTDPRRWAALREHFERLADLDAPRRDSALRAIEREDPALAEELATLLEEDRRAGGDDAPPMTSRVVGAVQRLAADLGLEAERARPAWIGDYRIVDTLGSGGMGIVYLAEQQSPKRTVALKVVRAVGAERSIRRFHREAELHGRLQHPHIAQVFEAGLARERDDSGTEHGPPRPYFAMEWIRGDPLLTAADRRGLGTAERVAVLAKVADAIDHAHARGVIHRDLKSANILVDEHGQPKILDFGIARALDRDHASTLETAAGEVIGTLPYMSPEQVSGNGAEIGAAADVYALGVVLFELLTGRRPLDLSGRSLPEAVRVVADEEPTRLGSVDRSLRGDLETIVGRCLEKAPSRRYPSAGALAEDLRRHLAHRPIEARPPSTLYQLGKFARRHRPLVTGVVTAFVALLAATIISVVMAVHAHRAQARAEEAGERLREQLRISGIENARSSQSFAFLSDLLTAADPSRRIGADTTVRDMVLRAAAALDAGAGGDNQVTGQLAHLIGVTLMRLGDAPMAERVLRRSVELLRTNDPAAVAPEAALLRAMASLAELLRTQGRLDDAEAVLRDLVEIRRRNIRTTDGREIPGVTPQADYYRSVAMNDLALIKGQRGDYAEAEALALRAHAMEKALVAMGHDRRRAMAITLWNAAENRRRLHRPRDAIPALEEAHAIAVAADGAESSVAQRIALALAGCLISVGRYQDAAETARPVVEMRKTADGAADLALAEAYLAQALWMRGEARAALEVAESSAAHHRAAGSSGDLLARSLVIAASARGATGDAGGAERTFAEALALLESGGGVGSEPMVEALAHRAAMRRAVGRVADAEADARAALEALDRRGARDERIRAAPERELALAMAASDDPATAGEGLRRLDEVTEVVGRLGGAEHPLLGRLRLARAEALRALGRIEEAAASADEAARRLADPNGAVPWISEFAQCLAEASRDPESASSSEFARRLERVRRGIEAAAGAESPEMARVARHLDGGSSIGAVGR